MIGPLGHFSAASPNIRLNIIIFVRLLHGFYCDFFSNICLVYFVRGYYFILSGVILYYNYYLLFGITQLSFYDNCMYSLKLLHYDTIFLVGLFIKNENFNKFYLLVNSVEINSKQSKGFHFNHTFIMFIIAFVFSVFSSLTILFEPDMDTAFYLVYNIIFFGASNLNHFTRIAMFEMLRERMKSLRLAMDSEEFSNVNYINIDSKVLNVKKYMCAYNNLLSSLRAIGHSSKFMMVLNLCAPLAIIFITINQISQGGDSFVEYWGIIVIEVLSDIILPCVPAVYGELINKEVMKIQIMLTEKYFICKDAELRDKLRDALNYMRLRPFRFSLWRLVHVNMTLPISMISLYTTFFIVIIQFKQL